MKKQILSYLALGCALVTIFTSCRKESFGGEENRQGGKTYVWVDGAPETDQFFDVFTDVKPVKMFTIRRDAGNEADLQKSVTVTLTALSQAHLDSLGSGYTQLFTTDIYTLPSDADVKSGGSYTGSEGITKTATTLSLQFAPGEFAKNVWFFVNGSKVDLAKKYAAAFVISNHGGFSGKHNDAGKSLDTVLSTVGIKNRWDGVYSATGTLTDITNSAIGDFNTFLTAHGADYGVSAPMQYEFRTISATACQVYDNYFYGAAVFPISSGDSYSQYGNHDPIITFDPATNKIVSITNFYGQGTNSQKRSILMDATANNSYDPTGKVVTAKWYLTQPFDATACPKCSPTAPYIRSTFDYTFKYIASR